METTYLQKLVLAIVFGAILAGGVKWFETFVTGADDAVNGAFRNRTEEAP